MQKEECGMMKGAIRVRERLRLAAAHHLLCSILLTGALKRKSIPDRNADRADRAEFAKRMPKRMSWHES